MEHNFQLRDHNIQNLEANIFFELQALTQKEEFMQTCDL